METSGGSKKFSVYRQAVYDLDPRKLTTTDHKYIFYISKLNDHEYDIIVYYFYEQKSKERVNILTEARIKPDVFATESERYTARKNPTPGKVSRCSCLQSTQLPRVWHTTMCNLILTISYVGRGPVPRQTDLK